MNKSEFLKCLRDLIGEGRTEDALDLLFDNINEYARYFANDVVMLKSQYHSAKGQFLLKGVIENAEFGRITAKVNLAILELADKIEKKSQKFDVQRKGHLLHQIPSTMVKDKETKCIIRIAYFLEHLYIGLTIDEDTVAQVIQVTGLMSVELLDDNEIKTFEIRTSTDEEQFIILEDFTQWIFKVRPLRIGYFPLLLKIGAVEIINGKERKRNIIIEKEINITIETPQQDETGFVVVSLEDKNYLKEIREKKQRKNHELQQLENLEKERLAAIEAKRKAVEERERIFKAEEEKRKKLEAEKQRKEKEDWYENERRIKEDWERYRDIYPSPTYSQDHNMRRYSRRDNSTCFGIILLIVIIALIWFFFFKN